MTVYAAGVVSVEECLLCGEGRPKGVHAGAACVKSHTARCVRKRAAAYFAGAWGAPNKQSKNAVGGRAVDRDIRKGYPDPLLAYEVKTAYDYCNKN